MKLLHYDQWLLLYLYMGKVEEEEEDIDDKKYA